MSLKLGNIDIAGTQVLYSTTGNNTDGAMTQAITTTQLNLKANDANVVHKTGNETISGSKTFTSNVVINGSLAALDLKNTDLTKGTTPTTASPYCGVNFKDKNGNVLGDLLYFYNKGSSAKETGVALRAFKANAASDSGNAELAILYPAIGNPYAKAPASDRNGSIVTTVAMFKANDNDNQDNYVKFGNGVLIQWGHIQQNSQQLNVTFPIPFKNTAYRMFTQDAGQLSGYSYAGVTGVTRTTTGATLYSYYANRYYDWLAIGFWY